MSESFADVFRSCWRLPFRGEIYEYGKKINLQKGYAIKGNFDVQKSRYLIEPFKALKNPRIRSLVILKALQSGGTLISDIFAPYTIEHDPGDFLWLFQDDDFAKKYCESRFMPMIDSIAEIQAILKDVKRHDKQKTVILFPHVTLIVGGLNEGNVQSLSWRYVLVDEAWMAKNNGLIRQAKARTTAFPYTSKFIVTSQAGVEGDDLDIEWKESNQNEWAWKCKGCGKIQPHEWQVRREDNSWAGVLWDTNDKTRPEGRWNMGEVLQTIRVACRYCSAIWTDTPETRRRIDDCGEYMVVNPGALPENAGYHWPAMACTDISLATLVKEYLLAKVQDDDYGYRLPLQEFYQKRLARAWSLNQDTQLVIIRSEPYDPNAKWDSEAYRFMTVDCQKDFRTFWVVIRGWALNGHSRQVYRGRLESWEQVAEKQKEFHVKDQHVFVDLGYEQTAAALECIKHGHYGLIRGRKQWLCWHGLIGTDIALFTHTNAKGDKQMRIFSPVGYINPNIGRGPKTVLCPYFTWSNLNAKDILRRHRDGAAGKFDCLPDESPRDDLESYTNQMRSEYRARLKDEKGRIFNRWIPVGGRKAVHPNHWWDCEAMGIVAAAIVGIIGDTNQDLLEDTKTEAQV